MTTENQADKDMEQKLITYAQERANKTHIPYLVSYYSGDGRPMRSLMNCVGNRMLLETLHESFVVISPSKICK